MLWCLGLSLKPEPENDAPHQAQAGKGNEREPPADQPDGGQHQRRGVNAPPQRANRPEQTLRGDAFPRAGSHMLSMRVRMGKATRLAGAEEENE